MKISSFFTVPATAAQKIIVYSVTLIVLMVLCGCYAHYLYPFGFPLDDPYIVLHNAQVLHSGHDVNYPGTPALDGSTSAVQLALVALLMFCLTPMHALVTLMWLAIFAYALGLLRLAFCFSASVFQALLLVFLGLTIVDTPLQLLNGLETGMAMAIVVWLFIVLLQPNTIFYRIIRNVICGTLPFIRPEFVLLSLLIFVYFSGKYRQQSCHAVIKNSLFDGAIMLLSALPWLLWYYCSTGSFYPETIHAKQYFMAETYLPIATKFYFFQHAIGNFSARFCWPGMIAALVLLLLTPLGRVGFVFIVGFLAAYFIYYPAGLFANYLRYFYIIVPVLLYGFTSACRHSDRFIRIGATSVLLITVLQTSIFLPSRWNFYLHQREYFTSSLYKVANWCNQHLPPNSVILVHDAGYMAYATPFHLIDLVGLKTPSNIYYHKTITFVTNGVQRNEAISQIMLHTHPNYLIMLKTWKTLFGTMIGLPKLGWHFTLLWSEKDAYSVYKITQYSNKENKISQVSAGAP